MYFPTNRTGEYVSRHGEVSEYCSLCQANIHFDCMDLAVDSSTAFANFRGSDFQSALGTLKRFWSVFSKLIQGDFCPWCARLVHRSAQETEDLLQEEPRAPAVSSALDAPSDAD